MAENQASNEQLTVWVETYKDLVYRIAITQVRCTSVADDVFQEVFLCLMRDSAKLVAAEEAHVKNWIIRTTYHRCSDYFRKMQRSKIVDYQDALFKSDEEEAQVVTQDHILLSCDNPSEKMKEAVYEAVLALPEDMRAVITLYYYQEFSVREIAAVLNIQENAAKTRLHRARKKLEKALERWR